MVSKNNQEVLRKKTGNKINRYGFRCLSVGVASVAVAGLLFASNAALVQAAESTDNLIIEMYESVDGEGTSDEDNNSTETESDLITSEMGDHAVYPEEDDIPVPVEKSAIEETVEEGLDKKIFITTILQTFVDGIASSDVKATVILSDGVNEYEIKDSADTLVPKGKYTVKIIAPEGYKVSDNRSDNGSTFLRDGDEIMLQNDGDFRSEYLGVNLTADIPDEKIPDEDPNELPFPVALDTYVDGEFSNDVKARLILSNGVTKYEFTDDADVIVPRGKYTVQIIAPEGYKVSDIRFDKGIAFLKDGDQLMIYKKRGSDSRLVYLFVNLTPDTSVEEYLAIFNGNGGSSATQKITVKDGEVVSGVVEPKREGYKFVKWVKAGTDTAFDLSQPFSKDLLDEDKTVMFTAVWEKEDTVAPTIDAGNVISVEGQPISPVLVDVDDPNASVKVDGLPEGLTYNPETKQIEGTVPKSDDWKDGEEVRELIATIIATNEEGKTTTKDITVTILRDTDGDGTPDATDTDDDNDGVTDEVEKEKGTDPKDPNSKPGKITDSIDPILPDRTEVGDVDDLTESEREHVKEAIEEVNKDNFPEGTDVTVNEDGSATITYPDGSKDNIKAEDLIKQAEKETSQADQIDPILPDRTEVGDVDDLTESEREHVKEAIEEANKDNFPEGTDVTVNEDGSATITYPDGSKDSIPAEQLIFQRKDDSDAEEDDQPSLADQTDITLPEKTGVKDINNLTEIEKEKVKIAITDANKLPKGTEVLVGSKGDVIINYPDGSHIVIDRDKLVYQLADSDTGKPADPDKGGAPSEPGTGDADKGSDDASDSKGGDKDSSKDKDSKGGDQGSSKDSKAKDSQDNLPQTGESSSAAILGLAGLSIMAGLGLVAGRRKEEN